MSSDNDKHIDYAKTLDDMNTFVSATELAIATRNLNDSESITTIRIHIDKNKPSATKQVLTCLKNWAEEGLSQLRKDKEENA